LSHFHFRLRLAECLRLEGDACGALAVLEEAVICKDVDAATTQLHALATLQITLLVGTCGAAKELECAGRVKKLIHSTTADPALQGWPNANLTYTLLHGLMLLRHGATSETGELCTVRAETLATLATPALTRRLISTNPTPRLVPTPNVVRALL
jgi:hypothetical protein